MSNDNDNLQSDPGNFYLFITFACVFFTIWQSNTMIEESAPPVVEPTAIEKQLEK